MADRIARGDTAVISGFQTVSCEIRHPAAPLLSSRRPTHAQILTKGAMACPKPTQRPAPHGDTVRHAASRTVRTVSTEATIAADALRKYRRTSETHPTAGCGR
jgi:hypothetical protein